MIRSVLALTVLALCINPALCSDLTPEDYQAALIEANAQIAGLSTRAQQLAITVAQQGREIAKLKAEAEKAKPKPEAPTPPPSPDAKQP